MTACNKSLLNWSMLLVAVVFCRSAEANDVSDPLDSVPPPPKPEELQAAAGDDASTVPAPSIQPDIRWPVDFGQSWSCTSTSDGCSN